MSRLDAIDLLLDRLTAISLIHLPRSPVPREGRGLYTNFYEHEQPVIADSSVVLGWSPTMEYRRFSGCTVAYEALPYTFSYFVLLKKCVG